MSSLARTLNTGLNLSSKISVVAGGSQGIGAGIAVRLARAGCSVVVIGRSKDRLQQVVEQCKAASTSSGSNSNASTFDFISADLR